MMQWLKGERPPKTDERVALVFAMIIVGGSGVMSIVVIVGCFLLVTVRYEIDQALLAICTGLISSILTGAGNSVQQIVSHYFNRKPNDSPQPLRHPPDPAGAGPDRQHVGPAPVAGGELFIDEPQVPDRVPAKAGGDRA